MVAHSNSAHTGRWARYFQIDQGMKVLVVSPMPDKVAGVDVVHFPRPRWYHRLKGVHLYLDYVLHWKRILAEFQADLVHVHYPDGGGRNRFYFDSVADRLITSTWGSEVTQSPEFPLSEKHRAGVRQILAKSVAVTATSQYLAAVTADYCRPGQRIQIIPFGVDCDLFKPAAAKPNTGLVQLGFFKNLEAKYGPEVLIEALAIIAKQCPQARLTMAGKGDQAAALQQQACELGIADRITFPGRLPHSQMVAAMQATDIFVMPSTCQESFGVAAIEASACDVPVVATRVGGVPEAVRDGQTGILVSPFDAKGLAEACIDLIGDPERRAALGKAGRQFVLDRYQWKANAATMASVYAQVLARGEVLTPHHIVAGEGKRQATDSPAVLADKDSQPRSATGSMRGWHNTHSGA
jgi:glycosyltransferase involved in cell wall biosynthesis